jgi:amicyanin
VTIKDFEFTPSTLTIKVGDAVTWTNNGPSTHTVTADDGSFESGNLSKGKTFSHTFNAAGTFSYHCGPHPFMTAKVIVQ